MKQFKNELSLVFVAAVALTAGACSSTSSKSDGGPGTGGASGGCVLTPSATGFVSGTDCGAMGPWYAYADGYDDAGNYGGVTGTPAKCQMAGHTDCSKFTTPTPGTTFPPSASGAMCTAGTVAQVPAMGASFDYSNVYGAAIALDLNNMGAGDSGVNAATKPAYDPTTKSPPIKGVAFDIDTPPLNALRVELPTDAALPGTSNDAAWWGGGSTNASPVVPGHNTFKWADVGGPMYLTSPPAFDVTQVTSIKFHIISNNSAAVPFSFCVSNLTLTY
jgi:hypothetical protein